MRRYFSIWERVGIFEGFLGLNCCMCKYSLLASIPLPQPANFLVHNKVFASTTAANTCYRDHRDGRPAKTKPFTSGNKMGPSPGYSPQIIPPVVYSSTW